MLGRKELRVVAIGELGSSVEAESRLELPLRALKLNKTVFEFLTKAGYGTIFDVYCLHSIELFGDDGLRPSYRREVIDKMGEFGFRVWAADRFLLHAEFCARHAQDDGVSVALTSQDKLRLLEGKHGQYSETDYSVVQAALSELDDTHILREAGAIKAVQWACERAEKPALWEALAEGFTAAKGKCELADLCRVTGLSANAIIYYCRLTRVSWCSV